MKELDELIAAVDEWQVDITRPDTEATMRLRDAAKKYVEIAKRQLPAASILTLLEEIDAQLTRRERMVEHAGGDPRDMRGNLTCYLPFEMLRIILRS